MSDLITAATDATFKTEVVDAAVPTLVDFWAPWCGPCKAVAPVLEEIATEFKGRVRVVKVNTDDNQMVAMQHNIRSIPTVMLFKGGKIVDQIIGAMPKRNFIEMLAKHL
jgi:thioredoxin 1